LLITTKPNHIFMILTIKSCQHENVFANKLQETDPKSYEFYIFLTIEII